MNNWDWDTICIIYIITASAALWVGRLWPQTQAVGDTRLRLQSPDASVSQRRVLKKYACLIAGIEPRERAHCLVYVGCIDTKISTIPFRSVSNDENLHELIALSGVLRLGIAMASNGSAA